MNTTAKQSKKSSKEVTPTPFDDLSDDAYVRMPTVRALNGGCTAVTIYRLMWAGKFPQSKKISPNMTAWRVGDLRKHFRSL